jgi:sRNA-binding carbon storage regulator CsrA
MMILTDAADRSQIYVLDDDTEIEITVIEIEGAKSKVVICTSDEIEVIHKLWGGVANN